MNLSVLTEKKEIVKFNPSSKDSLSYQEIIGPICRITEDRELVDYYHEYFNWLVDKHGVTMLEAITIAKSNIAYALGYVSKETRDRVRRVLRIETPILDKTNNVPRRSADEMKSMGCCWLTILLTKGFKAHRQRPEPL